MTAPGETPGPSPFAIASALRLHAVNQCPFHELQHLYAKHLHPGRFAALAIPNPRFPSDEFRDSVSRYLDGDAHELDIDVAGHLRSIACEAETLADRKHPAKRSQVRHFCASVVLTHFYCFDGGGFGHNEMPLVIALAVVGGLPDWGEPSEAFLTALLDGEWEQALGETVFFIKLARACIEFASPATQSGPSGEVNGLSEALEWNIDMEVPALAQRILEELESRIDEIPGHVRGSLVALARPR